MTTPVYVIALNKTEPTTGLYAIHDEEGDSMIQVFLDKDSAVSYNVHLEALGTDLHVCEIPDAETVYSLCNMLGYGYVIIQKNEVVVPRIETLKSDLSTRSEPS